MRKILIWVAINLIFALSFGLVSGFAVGEATTSIEADLYIGSYDTGAFSGKANIVFGTVNVDAEEFGVVVTDSNGNKKSFKALYKGDSGKFGVAIYNMPEGEYFTVAVYSGSVDNVSGKIGFWANQANEEVLTVDWNSSKVSDSVYKVREGELITPPDYNKVTNPENSDFAGFYTLNGEKFDFTKPIYSDTKLYARWVSDGYLSGKEITFTRDTSGSYRTNIGASCSIDLSNGGSVAMQMDVVASNLNTNTYIEIDALAWLPSGQGGTIYNNNYTSTGYIGMSGNPVYGESSAGYYGEAVGHAPVGSDFSKFTFGSEPFKFYEIFKAGNTVKIVYTAPTNSTSGSFVYYTKPSLADDGCFVERASMRGITVNDVYNTDEVYYWLSFLNGATVFKPSMTFRNFKVFTKDYELPVMTWNHADTELTTSDVYKTPIDKSHVLTVPNTLESGKAGYLMTKTAVNLSQGGAVCMEMDVIDENFLSQNVNVGVAIWKYLGLNNVAGSAFHDNVWLGNPAYVGSDDGYSYWKTEDVSNKTLPTISKFYVEDIFQAGNSVRIKYIAPTSVADGSILIFTKRIVDTEDKWVEVASVKNIKMDMVLDTSAVHLGIGISRSITGVADDYYLKVSNLRAYTELGDLEVSSQLHLSYVEDVAYIPEYPVNFNLNGAVGNIEGVLVKKGNKIPTIDMSGIVAPEGMKFDCWVNESGYEYNMLVPVTKRMTLTAKWIPDVDGVFEVEGGRIVGLTEFGKTLTEIVVPAKINGTDIVEIGIGSFQGSVVESLTISRKIRIIHDDAFRDLLTLDTVVFEPSNALKTLGDSVFRGCEALSNITLPKSVTRVGELCFYNAKMSGYNQLYSLNLEEKEYYSNKYVYEFLGQDVMPIGGYIEPSVGYFADGVTVDSAMKDFVDSGCNVMVGIGQLRYGTTAQHYYEMLQSLEKYGGMMLVKGEGERYGDYDGTNLSTSYQRIDTNYIQRYASYAGNHVVDEPGVTSWVTGLGEYTDTAGTNFVEASMGNGHLAWTDNFKRKLFYVNLLSSGTQSYAFIFGADNFMNTANNKLFNEYRDYATPENYYKTYIDYLNPEVFSYDYYPLTNEYGSENSLAKTYFEQLFYSNYYSQIYNKVKYGKTIPFWNFVQINGWNNTRSATYNELLWQINTAFVFGSKGYQYYCYNDYGDISGAGKPSGWWDTPINIDGTKNENVYNTMQKVNAQSQAMAKWLLNADVDHIAQFGDNPNGETIRSAMFESRDSAFAWSLDSSSGKNHILSYMKYVANNNEYAYGKGADVRELYFVCNNDIYTTNDGTITLNFDKTVSGSYIYKGVERRFNSSSLTVNTSAGEGFAVLLDK